MRILITGRDGQVARSLADVCDPNAIELHFAARPEVDLARPGALAAAIDRVRPDLVINAAAYTAVDRAETAQALAMRINADAAGEGAAAAAAIGVPFIQLSTDYVFNGRGERPWREDDPVDPVNAYGRTKAEGERRVLAAGPLNAIVRTSWLYGPFGHNFVRTMRRVGAGGGTVRVVADQLGRPTSTIDMAHALLALAPAAVRGEAGGIWHVAGGGVASWADLAEVVLGPGRVERIATENYPTPAARPANSVLDCDRIERRFGIALPSWRGSARAVIDRLNEDANDRQY